MSERVTLFLALLLVVSYSVDVAPILNSRCVECHSTDSDLDLSAFPFKSDDTSSQPAIVDLMLAKLTATPAKMPPGNRPKLSNSQVKVIQQWRDDKLTP